MRRWLSGLALLGHIACAGAASVSHEDFADLGAVAIISNPATPPRDLLLVLDAGAGIPPPLLALADRGHLVAHMPLPQFLQRAGHNECLEAVTLLDVFSQHLQQQFQFAHYQRPLLIGLDAAAPFALATLAQAPNRLFQAGIGVRFQPELTLPAPLCAAPGLSLQTVGAPQRGQQRYRLNATAPATPWRTVAELDALEAAIAALAGPAAPQAAAEAGAAIDDLPLVELPAGGRAPGATPADMFVVLISGDGGWANIDKDIGEALNRAGLPVVGWNSLQYFWRKKSPEQASADLARVIAHYQRAWQRPRVLAIGFSLGADVLPFMLSRLPAASRQAIGDTVLLSLGHQVDFEFHVSDWLGGNSAAARPIAPELARLAGMPILCIHGSADDSLCADRPAGVDVARLPGDHHFDGDYQSAVRLILGHLAKVRKAAPP